MKPSKSIPFTSAWLIMIAVTVLTITMMFVTGGASLASVRAKNNSLIMTCESAPGGELVLDELFGNLSSLQDTVRQQSLQIASLERKLKASVACTYRGLSGSTMSVQSNPLPAIVNSPSMALASCGTPVFSFQDADTHAQGDVQSNLFIAVCDDVLCTSLRQKILDSGPGVGTWSQLALRDDDSPVIVYHTYTEVRLLMCADSVCSGWTIRTVGSKPVLPSFWRPSLAITRDQRPVLMYFKDGANVTAGTLCICTNVDCSTNVTKSVDTMVVGASHSFITFLPNTDNPLIAYRAEYILDAAMLRLLYCNSTNCDGHSFVNVTVEQPQQAGHDMSLVFPSDGSVVIGMNIGGTSLPVHYRIYRCSTVFCTSYSVLSAIQTVAAFGPGGMGSSYLALVTRNNQQKLFYVMHAYAGVTQHSCSYPGCSSQTASIIVSSPGTIAGFHWPMLATSSRGDLVVAYVTLGGVRIIICSDSDGCPAV